MVAIVAWIVRRTVILMDWYSIDWYCTVYRTSIYKDAFALKDTLESNLSLSYTYIPYYLQVQYLQYCTCITLLYYCIVNSVYQYPASMVDSL